MQVDIHELNRLEEAGHLRISKCKDTGLLVNTYTDKAVWDKYWPPLLRMCRGLVCTKEGEVVARPFEKFFNAFEMPETSPPFDDPIAIWDKLDGSLLCLWFYEGEWRASTKGSFDNEYIDYAREILDIPSLGDKWAHMSDFTFCFEICLPEERDSMRRVVNHYPGLYFLAAIDRETGEDYTNLFHTVPSYTRDLINEGILFPAPDSRTIDEILKEGAKETGTEGWVAVFPPAEGSLIPRRIKFKTFWYLKLFRYINTISPQHIRECMLMNEDRDWLTHMPEEFRDEVDGIVKDIEDKHARSLAYFEDEYQRIYCDDAKEFARRAMKRKYFYLFFLKRKNHHVKKEIYGRWLDYKELILEELELE